MKRKVNKKRSNETKAGLQRAKARGTKLGGSNESCRNLDENARAKGVATLKSQARDAYADLLPLIQSLHAQGQKQQAIADELNRRKIRTRNGKAWTNVQVMRILRRANEAA